MKASFVEGCREVSPGMWRSGLVSLANANARGRVYHVRDVSDPDVVISFGFFNDCPWLPALRIPIGDTLRAHAG
jgi:hypothetical protein